MTEAELKKVLPGIPAQPGIYKYFDADKKLLYVGKAKHLRKRVSSYFTKTLQSYKTQELVRRIHTIEFTVVNSEQDAFFLENSLFKQYQPVFNIDLKDDKSYPFLKLTKEPYPMLLFSRRITDDGGKYFVSLIEPSTFRVGINDMEIAIYKRASMMSFPADSSLAVILTPEMPTMGHGSPNNINPVHTGNGHYKGKVNFTMTGMWYLNLDFMSGTAVADSTQFFEVQF